MKTEIKHIKLGTGLNVGRCGHISIYAVNSEFLTCSIWYHISYLMNLLQNNHRPGSVSLRIADMLKDDPVVMDDSSHQCYVTVVPCIVVHQCGSIGHARYLIAIIPPRHDSCMLVCVLPQPVVCLTEIIQNVS